MHKDGKDTPECLWSSVIKCKESVCTETDCTPPKRPCQREPDEWPKEFDSVKRKKIFAIRYLQEPPDFVENVSQLQNFCYVSS